MFRVFNLVSQYGSVERIYFTKDEIFDDTTCTVVMQNPDDAQELAEILNLDIFGEEVKACTEVINPEDDKPRAFELDDGSSSSKKFMSEASAVKALPPTNVCFSFYF